MSRIVTSRTLSIVEDGETDASNMLSGQWTVVTDSCTDWSAKGKMLQIDTFSDWGEIFNVQQFQYINGCKQMNNLKRKPYHNGVRSKTERHQCTSAISLCKKGAPQGSPGHSSHGSQIHHLLHQKNRKSYMVEDVKHHTIKRRFAPNSNTNTQMLILKYKYKNTDIQMQILKHKYTNTNIQIHK